MKEQYEYINPLLFFHSINDENNVVFNGVNGAVDVMLSETVRILQSEDLQKLCSLDENIIKKLVSRGYVFRTKFDYEKLKKSVASYQDDLLLDEPINIAILPTFKCNLKCSYCFEEINDDAENLPENYLPHIEKVLEFYSEKGKVAVELYGGEPFLLENYRVVEEIIKICQNHSVNSISVITNGTTLTEFYQLLKDYPQIKFNLQVTIDGTEKIHNRRRFSTNLNNCYEVILDGIKNISSLENVDVTIRTNIDDENYNNLKEFYNEMEERFPFDTNINYYATSVTSRTNPSFGISELELVKIMDEAPRLGGLNKIGGLHLLSFLYSIIDDSIIGLPKFTYCESARGKYIALAPDGYVYPCTEVVGDPIHRIGNFFPDFYIDAKGIEKWTSNNINQKEKCKGCSIRLLCGGGCALENYHGDGNLAGYSQCEKQFQQVHDFFDYIKRRFAYEV